jgi:hypothetical protein
MSKLNVSAENMLAAVIILGREEVKFFASFYQLRGGIDLSLLRY